MEPRGTEKASLRRRKSAKRPRHIIPTSIHRIALNCLVGAPSFESVGLNKTEDEVFVTPARWNSSEPDIDIDRTPVTAHSVLSLNEEKIKLRRKYSNATAMASPVLCPVFQPVAKMIDFGEETGLSSNDVRYLPPLEQRPMLHMSPVAASDPDLTRAITSREKRLKSLFKNPRSSIDERAYKQETIL